jgi:hypothetical protein
MKAEFKTINETYVKQFWQEGALLFPNVFSPEEVMNWRQEIEAALPTWQSTNLILAAPMGGSIKTDLLANALLSKLLMEPRIITIAHAILGAEPIYFGDSTFVYGPSRPSWHRDNRVSDRSCFQGLDWQGQYPLIRFGLYLQDHKQHSGGLGVRLHSHLPVTKKGSLVNLKFLPRRVRSFLAHHTGKAVHMDSSPGDLVIWNLRTLHSADSVRLRWFPKLRLAPFLENRLPPWAKVAGDGKRMACFMTFAAPSPHLDHYLNYLLTRDYMRDIWKHSTWDEKTLGQARAAGMYVINEKIADLMPTSSGGNK